MPIKLFDALTFSTLDYSVHAKSTFVDVMSLTVVFLEFTTPTKPASLEI